MKIVCNVWCAKISDSDPELDKLGIYGEEEDVWARSVFDLSKVTMIREYVKGDPFVGDNKAIIHFEGDWFVTDIDFDSLQEVWTTAGAEVLSV